MIIKSETISIVASVLAVIISVAAFWDTHHYNRIAIKPVLAYQMNLNEDDPIVGLQIGNDGQAPLLIKALNMYVDHKLVKDWDEVIDLCKIKNDAIVESEEIDLDTSIKAGDMFFILSRSTKDKKGLDSFLDCIDDHLGIMVHYCSIDNDQCATECFPKNKCN